MIMNMPFSNFFLNFLQFSSVGPYRKQGNVIHSDFLLHCVEKPKQTFGPTLYLLCPLLQTALHCSASPLEGTVVMAMKADLQRWVYKNETYIKGKKRDETLLWTNNRIP